MPIVHAGGNYLPGIYYFRVFFEAGNERGCPWYAPLQEEDHLAAYRPFLHPSKEAAIEAFGKTQHRPIRVNPEHLSEPIAPMTSHEEPLGDQYSYICSCQVDPDGEVDCLKRVALLDHHGIVTLLDFDEDFLISWPRSYIFETCKLADSHAPKLAM